VIKAVNKHQGLLRASVATIGQDFRLGANEAPPAIISVFLGAELEKAFESVASGSGDGNTPGSFLELGADVLPPLPMHGGDRNRTSPFAFTGNKFEFRAVGSSASLSFPNTVLNTIVAEAIDDLADDLEANGGDVNKVVGDAYTENKKIIFGGDNYTEEWHAEAEKRGLKNLKTTPDALPEVLSDQTVAAFEKYKVLSKRELESRFEVWAEQYAIRANIEAETTAHMGRTMIVPAALRYLALLDAGSDSDTAKRVKPMLSDLSKALDGLDKANLYPDGIEDDVLKLATYARDNQIAAMSDVREAADKLEGFVADDLWPLPKYSEMLFIK
jgi:glutamine synthetase